MFTSYLQANFHLETISVLTYYFVTMRILLHTCCANCVLFPLKELRKGGHEVTAFFYNHNIHPYQEYLKRKETLVELAPKINLPVICPERYDLKEFLRNVAFKEDERCSYCYRSRLQATVEEAKKGGYDCFSTTLLYSKFQKHDIIKKTGEALSEEYGIEFYYQDFRKGWEEGVRESKELNLYRQQYCGCIYSEEERYLQKGQRGKG
jgi:hypothetical protein